MSLFWNSDPTSLFWKEPETLFWIPTGVPTYQYDEDGRLTQVTYSDGTTVVYSYDTMGNRTEVVVTAE
jgi:YD repeat-containing protein